MNYIYKNKQLSNELLERFIRYVKIWSESDGDAADNGIFPSTPQQFDMAKVLQKELISLGIKDTALTNDCYVYAKLEGTGSLKNSTSILFLAHMDTVDEVSGENVNPQISYKEDDTIISSDKSTLLGADDKAGVAAIMSAISYFCKNPELEHCPIEVIFSPDEETGHGMDRVPVDLIKSKFACTVDGGHIGELESECFNASSAKIIFTGKASHTGDARKNGMINAVLLASKFLNNLPHTMLPETTQDHEGFIAPMEVKGSIESAQIDLLLRSFESQGIINQKQIINELANAVASSYGAECKVTFKEQYLNMKEKLDQNPYVLQRLEKAYKDCEVPVIHKPIRGGTDGSRLTEMGIPTPNIFTGAHEIHSRNEWCSLNQMAKASDIIISLCTQKDL